MKKLLLLAAAGAMCATAQAYDLPEGMVELLPSGVTFNIEQNKKFYGQKTMTIAGSPEKGYYAFFAASDAEHGEELWITDGTPEGTRMVKDINPGVATSNPTWITRFGEKVVFGADDGEYGHEVWISDGTEDGTYMIKDIHELESSNPIGFQQLDENHMIFYAMNMDSENASTKQNWLWITDGTEEGTNLVKEVDCVFPGQEDEDNRWGSNMRVGRKVFFKAEESDKTGVTHGVELWVTDGTEEGTYLVKDINVEVNASKNDGSTNGPALAHMQNFYNEKLFFKAWSLEGGNEPWAYDIATGECYQIFDTDPRVDANGIGIGGGVTMVGPCYNGEIPYRANDGVHGCEFGVTNCEKGNFKFFDIFDEEPTQSNNSYSDTGWELDGKYLFCAAAGFDKNKPNHTGGELRVYDGEKVTIQYDWGPGTGCNWVKEPLRVGGSLYWWPEQNPEGQVGAKTTICRLDKWDGIPEVVVRFDDNNNQCYCLRNLNGDLLFVSGATGQIYKYHYRSAVCDLEMNPDPMEVEFRTRQEIADDAALETIGEDVTAPATLRITPNPVVDAFKMEVNGQVELATLYTLSGAVVAKVANPDNNTMNVDGLSAGMYLLQVEVGGQTLAAKVIVK